MQNTDQSSQPDYDARFQEIPRERVADRVAQELMKLIATGKLLPGERLPGERQLAEMMNVSRVSVRAALQQLKGKGFVTAVQGGGTRVIAATDDQDSALAVLVRENRKNLRDFAQIRVAIEAWAARQAAENATDEQVTEIKHALDVMTDPDRPEEFKAEDDVAFHMAVAKAADSVIYMHLMSGMGDILRENLDYHRYKLLATRADDRLFLQQHRKIYEAIRDKNGELAAQAMTAHVKRALAAYAESEEAEEAFLEN
ncbi:FadR/GntR family transcriptional regulator [Pelagibius sp. Alg239-R121]|uniref:FadR/GntR family transcriptional regulator n=1 Tax=Pelagibius sp. Alg239-R121 TaxID=2993448 RepID=UPI0024A6DAF1|nr:FadR/GntR family transcriptional regulator [Pelagibius sp. Alg239-R121]